MSNEGYNSPALWQSLGFLADEAAEWQRIGIWNPHTAKALPGGWHNWEELFKRAKREGFLAGDDLPEELSLAGADCHYEFLWQWYHDELDEDYNWVGKQE